MVEVLAMTPEERKIDEIFDKLFSGLGDSPISEDEAKASLLQMLDSARLDEAKKHWQATFRDDYSEWSTKRIDELSAQLNPKEKES